MFCSPFQRRLLLQSVFLLLVHFDHDLVFLLQDLQLVFNVTSLAFEGGQCVLQLLVLFCGEMTLTLFGGRTSGASKGFNLDLELEVLEMEEGAI